MRIFSYTFLLLILVGCKQDLKSISENELGSSEGLLPLESTLVLNKIPSYTSFDMICTSDYLVICNGIANPKYYDIVNLENEKILGSVISEGGGPGEFAGTIRSNSYIDNSIISSSRGMGQKVYLINLDSALKNPAYVAKSTKEHEEYGVYKTTAINDQTFALLTLHDSLRLSVVNKQGNLITKFLEYPFQKELSNTRPEIFGMIFQGILLSNLENSRIAIFQYDAPNWDVIDFSNTEVPEVISQNHVRLPIFRDVSQINGNTRSYSVATSTSNKKGFVDATSNDNFIYALYSGNSIEKRGNSAGYGNIIVKMDWDGNIINRYIIDKPSRIIAVTQDNVLYSIIENETNDSLLKYNLSE